MKRLTRALRWARSHWEWIIGPPSTLLLLALIMARTGSSDGTESGPRTPVALATRVATAVPFAPVRVVRLEVEPKPLVIGEMGALLNGLCNDAAYPVPVAIYLGLQEAARDPIIARKVDLVGGADESRRYRITLPAGPVCIRTDPIVDVVKSPPGHWILVLNLTADGPAGEKQVVATTSTPFDVVAGR